MSNQDTFDGQIESYGCCSVFAELNPRAKEEQEAKRRAILESFRTAPFEDIVARSEAKVRFIAFIHD